MSKLPGPDLPDLGRSCASSASPHSSRFDSCPSWLAVSNPYLSQIERGLKRPSAEILQQLAHGLQLSAEQLYIKAGILEEHTRAAGDGSVLDAIRDDPALSDRQRAVLVDVYESFVGPSRKDGAPTPSETDGPTNPKTTTQKEN